MATAKKKILLIESDPQLVELMTRPLEEEGCEIFVARDGSDGLQLSVKA